MISPDLTALIDSARLNPEVHLTGVSLSGAPLERAQNYRQIAADQALDFELEQAAIQYTRTITGIIRRHLSGQSELIY
jgi:hypothetical protein